MSGWISWCGVIGAFDKGNLSGTKPCGVGSRSLRSEMTNRKVVKNNKILGSCQVLF